MSIPIEYESITQANAGSDTPSLRRALITIGVIASVAMVIISLTAKVSNYRINFIFLIPILWIAFYFRRGLFLTPILFALYASALLFHDMGAYGFYQHSPFHYSFDIFVHYWFGVVGTLILRNALQRHFQTLRAWQLNLTTLLFVMGSGALHEIMEYMSWLLLGEKGMMHPKDMYFFDTQRDLTNNLLGCLTALVLYFIFTRSRTRARDHTSA
jgi:uncharacterized membrane protein YjdF